MKRLLLCWLTLAAPLLHAAPIFNGTTLEGWEGDPKLWRVEDGAITGGSLTEKIPHNDFLCTTKEYGDFLLTLDFKLSGDPKTGLINSGIQVRTKRIPGSHEVSGYQCDIGDPAWWGAIYDEGRRNQLLVPSDMKALEPVLKRGDWNHYVIRAQGPKLTAWINGVQTAEWIETDPKIARRGVIGIQVHGGGCTLIQVKNITLEELPEPAPFIGAPAPSTPSHPSPLSPEEEKAAFTLPPGFEIELVAAEDKDTGKFVAVSFDQRGRMWSMTAFDYPVDGNENPAAAQALYAGKGRDKVLVWDTPFAPGPQKPRVFAEGLAIPLGLLPYKDGAYVQHGPNIELLRDTDNDGRADKAEVILSGFGVQDSHLFPHQFTRAPGGWIWMAQGAFNYGKVKTTKGEEQQFDRTRMARFRPDGSAFDITSQGPCNIWGLVLGGDGRAWIQEANDYGYPAMPFHAYANYPGCSDALIKSYAPIFPGTAPGFRMGGTGLSGLALSDRKGAWPGPYADVMFVANPITRKIQALRIHPDGPRDRLELLPDFVQSGDEWFRPVAIQFGPDGCLYIVDWYNKIISHNEVPRNHPDRDKTRGRIWRVKAAGQKPFPVPDFTKLGGAELLARLGGDSLAQSHLAWQAISDRQLTDLAPTLGAILADQTQALPRRIAALWALEGLGKADAATLRPLLGEADRNLRREAVRAFNSAKAAPAEVLGAIEPLADDPDPEVRAEVIRTTAPLLAAEPRAVALLVKMGRPALDTPTAPSTQSANKIIKVGAAYEREFERYLVRLFLEGQPAATATFLDSEAAAALPPEHRMLAALAFPAKTGASRVAALLPQLGRAPNQEELLRLTESPDATGAGEALKAILHNPASRIGALEQLLALKTRLDARKLSPVLTSAARELLAGDAAAQDLAVRLATGFQLTDLEKQLAALLESGTASPAQQRAALRSLREMGSAQTPLFLRLATDAADPELRGEALSALAGDKAPAAAEALFRLWPKLSAPQRRAALGPLASHPVGARALIAAVQAGTVARAELDAAAVEKLQTVLPNEPALAALLNELGSLVRPVLALDGSANAWTETGLALEGPFTLETWVRLEPGIGNEDGLLGVPDQLAVNFYNGLLRLWAGPKLRDVIIAQKPAVPDLWTHFAITRDEQGRFQLYQNGELDQAQSRPAPQKFENVRIAWALNGKGTAGSLAELRIWNRARSAEEIRSSYDRSVAGGGKPPGLLFNSSGADGWGKLQAGAKVIRTTDFPPVLTESEAAALDAKFAKYRALSGKVGDQARGKAAAAVCRACHLIQGEGGNVGPNLSGAGAMGVEGLLRNILTPNAAMENGYRIHQVEMKGGDLLDGFLVSEDKDALVLRLPGAEDRRIAKRDVARSRYLHRSLMPEGLLDGMSEQQVSDLFAYLMSLK